MKKESNYFNPLISFLVMIFAIFLWFAFLQTYKSKITAAQLAHTQGVVLQATNVERIIAEDKTATRGYALTGQRSFLDPVLNSEKIIDQNIDSLRKLVAKDPQQIMRVDSLLFYTHKSFSFEDSISGIIETKGIYAAMPFLTKCVRDEDMDNIRRVSNQIQEGENVLLQKIKQEDQKAANLLNGFIFIMILIFLALIIIYWRKEIQARFDLQQNEEQLKDLNSQINLSNDAIYCIDPSSTIINWNKGAERIFGYTANEAIGKNFHSLLVSEPEEGSMNDLFETLGNTGYWTGFVKKKTKMGKDVLVRASITQLQKSNDEVSGFIIVNMDITEQHQANKKIKYLASLVENSSETMFSRDKNLRILSWNRGAEKLFGYSTEEAIGNTFVGLGATMLTIEEILKIENKMPDEGIFLEEVKYFRKDGTSFIGEASISPIKNKQDEPEAYTLVIRDISKRKMLQEELVKMNQELEIKVLERTKEIEQNNLRFRGLIENSHDIITLFDKSYNIIYRSPSASRITGWTNEDLLNKPVFNVIHPDYQEQAYRDFKLLKENPENSIKTSFRYLHKNGHYIWMDCVARNLLHDENVRAIVINFHDVTQRVESEEKLVNSELKFRSLIENSAEGVSLLDENGRAIYRSPSFYRILGQTVSAESIMNVHPEDRELMKEKLAESKNRPGEPVPYQIRYIHSDGHYVRLEGSFTNLLHLNGVNAFVANFRDISEKYEIEQKLMNSERRFRTVIENISDGIVLNTEDSQILYQSPSVSKILGYGPEERVGKMVNEYIHPDNLDEFNALYERLRNIPNLPLPFRFRFKHKNGKYIWLEGVVSNLLSDPSVKAYLASYRDITERVEEQQKITRALYLGQEQERKFIAQELHDNVNQLQIASTLFLSSALRHPDSATRQIQDSLDTIKLAIVETRELTHKLTAPDFQTFQLSSELVKLANNMLKQKGIEVLMEDGKFKEDNLKDEQKLAVYRIAQEQTANIIKYANAKKVTITLIEENGIFKMSIADDGVGMENVKSMNGIGLKNIKNRLSIFGGETKVNTSAGKGFELEISMPVTK